MPAARFSKLTLPTPAAIERVSFGWPFCISVTTTLIGLAAVTSTSMRFTPAVAVAVMACVFCATVRPLIVLSSAASA